ncbi:putative tail tuber protein B [Pseudomonas phage BIM BV-45]|nr:putative tail tuber protein B [Pseudomonas phage BIM BV-45]
MSKVTGSYESLIKGVSEQVAHQRFPGQVWEQVNMVSDPVRGLARRRGSVMVAEKALPGVADTQATRDDAAVYGEQSLYLGVNEYSIMHRKRQMVAGSQMPPLVVFDKTGGKLLNVSIAADDAKMTEYGQSGFNSITAVGNLVLLAPRGHASTYTSVDQVTNGVAANSAAGWVKGGSYSRTYTLSFKRASDNSVHTVQYTTPTSYYPGILDTSDIPATNPDGTPNKDYQKLVNDRVYAYQKAVNQWIGTSAAAIQPQAIAASLQALVNPLLPGTSGVIGSTIIMGGVVSISCDDGGDGSQFIGVARTVKQASDLTTVHRVGKVVKIKPTNGTGKAYYVKAVAKDGTSTGWTQVIWEECPGVLITPVLVCAVGAVKGGTFYVASTPAKLAALAAINVPPWAPSSSGDLDSQSLPAFLDREINYIRMFQDRLIVIAGATVFMSRSGDYFNFFRTGALNIQDNDPIEVYALGSEDDVITAGTLLDRNLILFGKQWQYAVPGRDAIVPQNAFVAVQSGYRDSNTCPPESSGNLIFFGQKREGKLAIQQMQTGAYADTLDAFEITQQLNKYLVGQPLQIEAVTSPSALFIRTDAERNGVWVYSYLDAQNNTERLFDSWSKWQFNKELGNIVAMTTKDGDLYVTTLRATTQAMYLVTDRFTLNTDVPDAHIDSMRPYISIGTVGEAIHLDQFRGAYNKNSGRYWLQGDAMGAGRLAALREQIGVDQDVNLNVGAAFDSYVVLTNPYIRDKDGKAILDGRLTLGNMNVTTFESSAMDVSICDLVDADNTQYQETLRWVARNANDWVLNTQQVADTASVVVGVYKEVRDCKVKLAGRSWLPLTLSAIEWQGQFFTRRRA